METKTHETLTYYGDSVKALGDGRIAGYLVRFGGRDLEGEYFTKDTYFGARNGDGVDTVFHHGIPIRARVDGKTIEFTELADTMLPPLKAEMRELGIWAETVMDMHDEYQAQIYELANKGKLGWSSGALSHLVRYGENGEIKKWVIGEGSLTPTPAEPRNVAIPVKSLQVDSLNALLDDTPDSPTTKTSGYNTNITYGDDGKPIINISNTQPNVINSDNAEDTDTLEAHNPEGEQPDSAVETVDDVIADDETQKTTHTHTVEVIPMTEQPKQPENQVNDAPPVETDALKARVDGIEKTISDKLEAMMKMFETEPRINRSGYVTVDGGTADSNIKNAGDMLLAIKRGDKKRLEQHYGLKAQYENDGTTGGYYVPDQVLTDMMPGLSLTSGVGNLVTRIPVQSPAGEMPIRDYSRTPTANTGNSASAQGIESQARSEGGAYTEETIYFELLNYRVTDATSGYVEASRELAQDFNAIEGLLRAAIQEEVGNKEEYFILRGNGVNQPLGVLNWSGTVDIAEDTADTFAVEDADEMLSRFIGNNPATAAWVHHPSVIPSIAGFERGTGGAVYHSNIPGAMPESLHGYTRFNSQHMPSKGGNRDGYIVLGDWSKYFIFERGGLYIDFSEHARFLNGEVVWRFGKRFDGKPSMTSAVTLADGTFTVSPFVAIEDTD